MKTILVIHILAGFAALGAAGLAIVSTKGADFHRRAGRFYAGSMLIVGATALVLAVSNPNAFLFTIGLFSLYLVFTGWRAATIRDGRPRWADHTGGVVMALAGLAMLVWGALSLMDGDGGQPLILLLFGSIGLSMALADWRDWHLGPITGNGRITRHLGRMLGGTIATITAAGVVNLGQLPDLVVWLGPTGLIVPLIFWWSRRLNRTPAGN